MEQVLKLIALLLGFVLNFVGVLGGETCVFNSGDSTVSVFCDDGCCNSQCCGNSDVDDVAIAIAVASVIGLLLAISFILLLCYCYHRRKKQEDDEERNARLLPRNNVHPAKLQKRHNFSQTGEMTYPNIKGGGVQRERLVEGNQARWNSYNPYPRPQRPGPIRPFMHRQTQTGNPKGVPPPTGPDLFAASRAMRSNLVPAPEPHVPAPYWRYHKKGPTESKDVYSLMERKAKHGGTNRERRVTVANRKDESVSEAPGQDRDIHEEEIESDNENRSRSPMPSSLSD